MSIKSKKVSNNTCKDDIQELLQELIDQSTALSIKTKQKYNNLEKSVSKKTENINQNAENIDQRDKYLTLENIALAAMIADSNTVLSLLQKKYKQALVDYDSSALESDRLAEDLKRLNDDSFSFVGQISIDLENSSNEVFNNILQQIEEWKEQHPEL